MRLISVAFGVSRRAWFDGLEPIETVHGILRLCAGQHDGPGLGSAEGARAACCRVSDYPSRKAERRSRMTKSESEFLFRCYSDPKQAREVIRRATVPLPQIHDPRRRQRMRRRLSETNHMGDGCSTDAAIAVCACP